MGFVCSCLEQIVGRVPGLLKMTGKDAVARSKAMPGEAGTAAEITATLAFEPPCLCRWSRFDAAGNTSFITAFYCVPSGTSSGAYTRVIAAQQHCLIWKGDSREKGNTCTDL